MFLLVVILVTIANTVHPVFWADQPGSLQAITQGIVAGLIIASVVTTDGRKGWTRISRVILQKG